jgi:hypothetical protein
MIGGIIPTTLAAHPSSRNTQHPTTPCPHRQGADGGNGELDRWRGHTTGHDWALPPRDHLAQRDLIGGGDLDELAQAQQRYDL